MTIPLRPLLFAALLCAAALPAPAQTPPVEVEYTNEQPLIVIRFNQPRVMYERALYNTVARALEVKPQAMFDVVSVAPRASAGGDQAGLTQSSSQNTAKVLRTLSDMGLPQERIHLTRATDAVSSSEVRIFVR